MVDVNAQVDAVTRKGSNAEGVETFIVQAGAGRAAALSNGFPTKREDLFACSPRSRQFVSRSAGGWIGCLYRGPPR